MLGIQQYDFILTGKMPLLMHADDVMEADKLVGWRMDTLNKNISVAGDDRSPAWTWQTYLYHNGEYVVMPQECILAALRFAGAKIQIPGKRATFKALSQSGLVITSETCEFRVGDRQISLLDIQALRDLPFSEQIAKVKSLGFQLMVKRAAVGQSKHVRVRAMFTNWSVRGSIMVQEPAITAKILEEMLNVAGSAAGLCDWRPSAKKSPGPYGTFTCELKEASTKGKRVA